MWSGTGGGLGRGVWAYVPNSCNPCAIPLCTILPAETPSGHNMRRNKVVQMTQNWIKVLLVGQLLINPFHISKKKFNHIGFNVCL